MESKEYMEIRNALTVLTKITSIFPVMRKSGINIEKRVNTSSLVTIRDMLLFHSLQIFLPGSKAKGR
jgi:predicted AAA+ superfamily ATPase